MLNNIEGIKYDLRNKLYFGLVALVIYEIIVFVFLKSYLHIFTYWNLNFFAVKYSGYVIVFTLGYSFGKFLSDQIGETINDALFSRKIFFDFIKKLVFILLIVSLALALNPFALFMLSLSFMVSSGFYIFSVFLISVVLGRFIISRKFFIEATGTAFFVCMAILFLINGTSLFYPNFLIENFITAPPMGNAKHEKQVRENDKMIDCQKKADLAKEEYIKINEVKKPDGTIFISDDVSSKAARAGGDVWKNCSSTISISFQGF